MRAVIYSSMILFLLGCSANEMVINGLVCPPNKDRDSVRADFNECQVYDIDAASTASISPLKREQQECMSEKGYKVAE